MSVILRKYCKNCEEVTPQQKPEGSTVGPSTCLCCLSELTEGATPVVGNFIVDEQDENIVDENDEPIEYV